MNERPVKRSLTLKGHRTSVSLEDDFWRGFCEIAQVQQRPINNLAAEIDANRGTQTGLATAIRLFVFRYYKEKQNPAPTADNAPQD